MALPKRARVASGAGAQERSCPVCMEHTERDWFSFPCGHSICAECNGKMIAHRFLSCPTCRTPREGVSQRQVEQANEARAERQSGRVGGRGGDVMFFPIEANGADPFRSLDELLIPTPPQVHLQAWGAEDAEDVDEALARATQAEEFVRGHMPHLRTSVVSGVTGPMRTLVHELLRPGTMEEFLAHREAVRHRSA